MQVVTGALAAPPPRGGRCEPRALALGACAAVLLAQGECDPRATTRDAPRVAVRRAPMVGLGWFGRCRRQLQNV